MPAFWVGIDSGKRAHHCVVIDQAGTVLLSKRVENDENELLELIATIAEIAGGGEVCWATDLNAGGAALLIELLAAHAQQLLYIPGRIVHHAAATYRGDGKTNAKDARIIADQARMRTDLQPVRGADQISVDLRLLTARRTDLICDRVRAINRLRATLLEYFPALERAFDYSKKAPLILLGGYQTPEGIRRIGLTRLTSWLRKRARRNSAKMAEKAITAANSQHTVLPTQSTGSGLVVRLAEQISTLDAEIADVDAQITELFRQHEAADILLTMPGFGPILAATFLSNIGGNLEAFDSVDRLASVAGLAPSRVIPGESAGTFIDRVASTAGSCEPVISPPSPASRTARPHGSTTTGSAEKESPINRPSSPSPGAASTSSGPCSATIPPIRNQRQGSALRRLDRNIEIPSALELVCRRLLSACLGS
jgi:transposase